MAAQGSPETSLSLYCAARGMLHLGTWNRDLLWKTLGSELLPPVCALQLVCDLEQVVSLLCQLWNVPVMFAFSPVKCFQNYRWQEELFIINTFTWRHKILHYPEVRSMLLYNRNFFHPFLPSPTPIFIATHNLLSQFAIALGMSGYRVLS